MTLDESIDNKDELNHNGITAYIDSGLRGSLEHMASTIAVDFVDNEAGQSGFTIRAVGEDSGSCGSCPSASSGCS